MTAIALSGSASACRALWVFKRLYNLWAERLHMAAWLIHLNKHARHATLQPVARGHSAWKVWGSKKLSKDCDSRVKRYQYTRVAATLPPG